MVKEFKLGIWFSSFNNIIIRMVVKLMWIILEMNRIMVKSKRLSMIIILNERLIVVIL